MGFGTLFIGFFFILNFAYSGFTDAIAALITLYAAYKLSFLNKNFKLGTICALVFAVFGIFELGYEFYDMIASARETAAFISAVSIIRYLVICALSLFLLLGMRDVANEVKLRTLAIKCERVGIMSLPIYALSIILELLGLCEVFGARVFNVLSVLLLVCNLTVIVMTLVCIYSCYMRICMPGEPKSDEQKQSRFGFVNALRRHEEEKQREYAEYRLQKFKKAQEKKKEKQKNDRKK